MRRGRLARQYEDAGADNCANAEQRQVDRAEDPLQRLVDIDGLNGLGGEQGHAPRMSKAPGEVLKMNARSPESFVFGPASSGGATLPGVESQASGSFRFIPGDGLWRNGRIVALPPRAVGVLWTLLATPGVVVSKQSLMDAVWPDTFVTESSLLEAIALVRDALGDDRKQPAYIKTAQRRRDRFFR